MKIYPFFCVLYCVVLGTASAQAEGRIEIESFTLSPTQLKREGAFELSVTVKAFDVSTVNYVLRTSQPVRKTDAPPSFDYYVADRKLAYMQEEGQVHLRDNGNHDLDPKEHAFRIQVNTKDWPLGRHDLVLFAHNRPGAGNHIKDSRQFFVWIEENGVRIAEKAKEPETRFIRCEIVPAVVEIGEQATLHLAWSGSGSEGFEVRRPYYARAEHAPAPFTYDAKHISRLMENDEPLIHDNGSMDSNQEVGALDIALDTTGWQPGLYYLEINSPSVLSTSDKRHRVLNVRAPEDQFDVQVSPSWPLMPGTHADRMTRLADGTLLHTTRYSADDGKTWQKRATGTIGIGCVQLRDGRVLGMGYRKLPIEGRDGWYRGERYESTDRGHTVTGPLETLFYVPQAKAAQGHAHHPGPLFMRSIVERPDGSLIALMAGWFKGDDEPCPYSPKRPYSRTYTCESEDGGMTWRYLSTIGYDHIGSEGYNEGSMKMLPDGRLMAVLRTGSMSDPKCQDNPIMVSMSDDGGKTWTIPRRTGAQGAFPDLAVLSDGTLALSYGRPGANVAFSTDNGLTWHDHTSIDPTPYSGYTTICEVAPGEIIMVFGTKKRINVQTGEQSDGLRVARIHYRKKDEVVPLTALEQKGVSVTPLGEGFYDCSMYSKALGREERFALHLPAAYTPEREKPLPLITFLHGAGRHHLTLIEHPQTRAVIMQSPAVFLSPNGASSWWVDSPVTPESRYASFLEECITLVTTSLPISQNSKHRAIGGWSMGGFGSANFAESHAQEFGAWAGILGLLDFPNAHYDAAHNHSVPTVLGDESQQALFNPLPKAAALRNTSIMFITAESAFDCLMNDTFAATLTELEIPHSYKKLKGAHTFDVVLKAFPRVMNFFHEGFDD